MSMLEVLQKHNNEKRERDRRLGKIPTAKIIPIREDVAPPVRPTIELKPLPPAREDIREERLDAIEDELREMRKALRQEREEEQVEARRDPHPSVPMIIRAVSAYYKVGITDLKSARRTASVVRPRQIAMYLAKTLTLRSLPDIGRRFGGRDHTTVLHGHRKIEALIRQDNVLAGEIEYLTAQLIQQMDAMLQSVRGHNV